MTVTPAGHRPVDAVHTVSPGAAERLLGHWRAPGPAYVALSDAFRSAVLSGALPALTRLPSERELARALRVSRTTTSAAYARLRELGYAVSRVGSGTVIVLPRVATPITGARPGAGDAPVADVGLDLTVDMAQATPSATEALHDAYVRALEALPAYLATGGYAHLGIEPLREAVAARYRARGVPTTADQILITTGAQQAIAVLATALVGRTDSVVVESPTYFHAVEALRGAGARVLGVPPGDVESLTSVVHRVRPRLVYLVPDFHNPTGRTMSAPERRAVGELAARYGTIVIGDETLTDIDLDGVGVPLPFALDGTSTQLVSVGSASKSFWGGLRIGWVRAEAQLVQRLARVRGALDVASPVLEQLAVVELLGERDAILPARRAELRARRDLLVDRVRQIDPGWEVPRPPGGLCLWVGLGRPVGQALATAAVREGLRIAPGPQFTVGGTGRDHVRLTFTPAPEALHDAAARLHRSWRRLTSDLA